MAKSNEEKNSEYWEKRIASETWKTYNSLEEKNRELLEFYIEASESVKDELYLLAEKLSKDGVLSLSEMHKQNRFTELNKKFEKIIEELGHATEDFAKKSMHQGFQQVYENVAVSMGEVDFSMPNKELMEKLMDTPWRGDTFSKRLWKNQKKLAVSLNDILLVGLQQGKTVTEIAIMLHNRMGHGFNECHRLVRTETMHYLNDATLHRYKDAGVEYVQIWAAVDERTCDICGGYHEEIYPIDKCPHIPFHANCRCTILPVTDAEVIVEYEKNHSDELLNREYNELSLEEFKKIHHTVSKDERSILYGRSHLSGYINSSNARKLNGMLRNDETLPSDYLKIADIMSEVIGKNVIPEDILVTRYVKMDALEGLTGVKPPKTGLLMSKEKYAEEFSAIPSQIKKGHIYEEKGFLSTSGVSDKNVMQEKSVVLNIKVPKGTNGYITTNYKESEIIFDRGTKLEIYDSHIENYKVILECIMR